MPTVTIYAATDDGHIQGTGVGYASARATSSAHDDSSATMITGQTVSGPVYAVYQSFLRFDTSSIPDDATITAATINVYLTAYNDAGGTFEVYVYRYAWASTLAANREANYDAANAGSGTLEMTLLDTSEVPATGEYKSQPVDTAGINKSGYSSYYLAANVVLLAIEPGGAQTSTWATADASGTSTDPYLEITYTTYTLPGVPNGLMMMGCGT